MDRTACTEPQCLYKGALYLYLYIYIYIYILQFACKLHVVLATYLKILKFHKRFSKNIQTLKYIKTRPVRTELFHADGQTDGQTVMTRLIVAFHNFAKARK
jgi:hypothetical protein